MPGYFQASLITSIAAAALLPLPGGSAVERVAVRTYDTFGVTAASLSKGEEVAGRILQDAGIQVIWRNCSAGCADVVHPGELIVRIATAPPGVLEGSMGCAVVDVRQGAGSLATVYADRITMVAARTTLDPRTLLGRAMAHEIGHLLMGTATHSASGLMRAVWSDQDLRQGTEADWRFTPEDMARINRRLDEVTHS
jgi:hypothetical protein